MTSFFDYLAQHKTGIVILAFLLFAVVAVIQWLTWIFGRGRFSPNPQAGSAARYIFENFFGKIINEFRHLLALVITLMFAVSLFVAMWPGIQKGDVNLIKEGLQGASATLGGLIGSIIGYYFGEARSSRNQLPGITPDSTNKPAEQQVTAVPTADIQKPAKPPTL